MKIIATSSVGQGFLPMKQSKEQEDKKTDRQQKVEICNFVKNAFCVDGTVSLLDMTAVLEIMGKEVKGGVFVAKDKVRGEFYVSFGNL